MAKPFFLYMPWQGVHAPLEAPIHYVEPYAKRIANPTRRIFAGMISAVDEGMGNLTRALEEKHMLSNAVIVVTSDNGAPISATVFFQPDRGWVGFCTKIYIRRIPETPARWLWMVGMVLRRCCPRPAGSLLRVNLHSGHKTAAF